MSCCSDPPRQRHRLLRVWRSKTSTSFRPPATASLSSARGGPRGWTQARCRRPRCSAGLLALVRRPRSVDDASGPLLEDGLASAVAAGRPPRARPAGRPPPCGSRSRRPRCKCPVTRPGGDGLGVRGAGNAIPVWPVAVALRHLLPGGRGPAAAWTAPAGFLFATTGDQPLAARACGVAVGNRASPSTTTSCSLWHARPTGGCCP